MARKYFVNCNTCEELKKEYRKLAKMLHPDMNPGKDTENEFKEMVNEFEKEFERLKNIHVNKDGDTYEKETSETAAEFMDLINKLLNIPGVEVEICGSWLWVTGDTKPAKDTLKEYGFKFSRTKLAWYYHREPYRKHSKKTLSMDDIRKMYGSAHFRRNTPDPDFIPEF